MGKVNLQGGGLFNENKKNSFDDNKQKHELAARDEKQACSHLTNSLNEIIPKKNN